MSSFQLLPRNFSNSPVDIFDLLPRKWANSSDLFFDSSEVSFDSSEEFFRAHVEISNFLPRNRKVPPLELKSSYAGTKEFLPWN